MATARSGDARAGGSGSVAIPTAPRFGYAAAAQPFGQPDPLRQAPSGRSRQSQSFSFRGQSAPASAGRLPQTLGRACQQRQHSKALESPRRGAARLPRGNGANDTATCTHANRSNDRPCGGNFLLHRQRFEYSHKDRRSSYATMGFQRTRGPRISFSTSTIRSWRAASCRFVWSSSCGSSSIVNHSSNPASMASTLALSRACCISSDPCCFHRRVAAAVQTYHASSVAAPPSRARSRRKNAFTMRSFFVMRNTGQT